MKVHAINLQHLNNGEHFMYFGEVSHIIETNNPASIDLATHYGVFKTALAKEDEAYMQVQKSAITKSLTEADGERDTIYRGFRSQVSSLAKHFNADNAEAAYRLMVSIDAYGDLSAQSYEKETANLYNLLQDLHGKHAADIAQLSLTDWVTELEKQNKSFDELMKSRYSESADKASTDSMRSTRLETDKAYMAMRERLNAAIIFNGEAKYAKTVTELNVVIKRYNDILARRKGSSKKK